MEFWELTPYEFRLVVESYGKRKENELKEKVTLSYVNALWTIQWLDKKKPKPLKEVLKDLEPKKKMTDKEMLDQIKKINAMLGGDVN